MKQLNTAIIGCGSIVQAHVEVIRDITSLVAVCDIDRERADQLAHRHGCKSYYSVDELLRNESLDIVHLLTPHHVRASIIQKLSDAGIHVLVEKPVAMNLAQGHEVLKLTDQCPGIKIGVVYQNRFNETTRQLQRLVAEEAVGQVHSIRANLAWNRQADYYAAAPWRAARKTAGGGVLINQAIHLIDLLQMLGGKVDRIDSAIHRFRHKHFDIEDTATVFIEFDNGVTGSLHATVAHGENSPVELEVAGDKGRLIIQNYTLWLDPKDGPVEKICDDSASGVKAYYGGSHCLAIQQFYQAVIDDTGEYLQVSEALKSLTVIEEVYRQNATH